MLFVTSFKSQKRAKVIMLNFKISRATYCSRTILDGTKQQNEMLEFRIFSNPINFFHFYLIYFYTHGISAPENTPTSAN